MYKAFPDLILTNQGKLVCVFLEFANDTMNPSALMYTTSVDQGKTWSEKKLINLCTLKNAHWDAPRICKLSNGNIVILSSLYKNKNHSDSYVYMWNIDSEFTNIGKPIKTSMIGIVPDKILELPDKTWLISTHIKNEITKKNDSYVYFSNDEGHTWTDKKLLCHDDKYSLCETSITNIDNILVAVMRENSGKGIDAIKCLSIDFGQTWSEPKKMSIPGCHRPVVTKLLSGKYLITYRFDQGKTEVRGMHGQNIMGAILDLKSMLEINRDNSYSRIFPIDYDRNIKSNCGYTGVVQFEDGMIYVVSFIIDDNPVGQIRGYSFYESDIILDNIKEDYGT